MRADRCRLKKERKRLEGHDARKQLNHLKRVIIHTTVSNEMSYNIVHNLPSKRLIVLEPNGKATERDPRSIKVMKIFLSSPKFAWPLN